MSNPFARKMESFVRLPPEDVRDLEAAVDKTRRFGPREDVIRDGEEASALDVLLDGWACRYKVLPDGRRQIVGLLIPGDMCDAHALLLPTMAHSLGTITAATLARVPGPAVGAMVARSAALAEALNWEALVGAEIQREWMVSLGRRTAVERLAHLFAEPPARLRAGGRAQADGAEFEFPLTQTDLADALGLSTVHVNRTLQELKARRIIELRNKRLVIQDRAALEALAMFDPAYLHQRSARDNGRLSAPSRSPS